MKTLTVHRLGRVEYEDGLALMARFGQARREGQVGDTLLLLEHPPVLTLGRGAKRENILAQEAQLSAEGVTVFETNRGGDVTYHGPGQVVGYPLFLLPPERRDVRRYVRDVERSVMGVLSQFGLSAKSIPTWPGVWLGEEGKDARKIAAIGVHLSRWLTSHGFALNVNTQLNHFGLIVPCGIREAGVTSMQRELGRALSVPEVEAALAERFAQTFDAQAVEGARPRQTVTVAVLREAQGQPEVLLLKRRPERGGFWQLVTGWVEEGETPLHAAAREVEEETGWSLPVRSLAYQHTFALGEGLPVQLVEEHAFVARAAPSSVPALSEEHEELSWLPLDEALQRLPFAGLKEAVRRAKSTDFGG